MKALVVVLALSRLATCGILPSYHGVTIGINENSAPVHSSYFHEQDHFGQYVYGYASKYHAKDEIKTADGITRGGYSYIDANGILQTVQYISDPINGFRVSASNIPRDLPEVALAKVQHYHAYENIKREHALIAAKLSPNTAIPLSPIPQANSYIVPISTSKVLPVTTSQIEPVPYVPQEVHYIPVPVSSQHHAQDGYGQYSYGYTGPLSSKTEVKTADGVTRGGYSYIDAHGVLQSVQYISDPVNGFRVEATNLPEAPQVTLVGPKVTTSVVAPKDTSVPVVPENLGQYHGNVPVAPENVYVPGNQPSVPILAENPVVQGNVPIVPENLGQYHGNAPQNTYVPGNQPSVPLVAENPGQYHGNIPLAPQNTYVPEYQSNIPLVAENSGQYHGNDPLVPQNSYVPGNQQSVPLVAENPVQYHGNVPHSAENIYVPQNHQGGVEGPGYYSNAPYADYSDSQPLASASFVNPVIIKASPENQVPDTSDKSEVHSIPFRSNGRIVTHDQVPGKVARNTNLDSEEGAQSQNVPVYQKPEGIQYVPQYGSGAYNPNAPQDQGATLALGQPQLANHQPIPQNPGVPQTGPTFIPNQGSPYGNPEGPRAPLFTAQPQVNNPQPSQLAVVPQGLPKGLNLAQEGYAQPNLAVYREGGSPQSGILSTPAPSVQVLRESSSGAQFPHGQISYNQPTVTVTPRGQIQVLSTPAPFPQSGAPGVQVPNYQGVNQPNLAVQPLQPVGNPQRVQTYVPQGGLVGPQVALQPQASPRPQVVLNQGQAPHLGAVDINGASRINLQGYPQPSLQGQPPNVQHQSNLQAQANLQHQASLQAQANLEAQAQLEARAKLQAQLETQAKLQAQANLQAKALGELNLQGGGPYVNNSPRPVTESSYPGPLPGTIAPGAISVTPRPEYVPQNIPQGNVQYVQGNIPSNVNPNAGLISSGQPVAISSGAISVTPRPDLVPQNIPQGNVQYVQGNVPSNAVPNTALISSGQASGQPVSEERVNSIQLGELDLENEQIFEEANPDDFNNPNVAIGNGYIIRGPTHNPNKQVSGHFNQTLYF